MPLKQIQKLLKMDSQKQPNRKDEKHDKASHRKNSNFAKKKDKFGRKRSQSFCSGVNTKFCAPYKCRKRPMLPTKFLLGGNICDPLNLNSLQDEEINRTVNAVTPKSSPVPTPPQRRGHIEVIIPPNIHDPLNLIDCADDAEYEQQLTSPLKKGSKRRKKKKRTSSATTEPSDADVSSASEAQTPDVSIDSAKIPEIDSSLTSESSPPKEKIAKVTRDLKLELSPVKDKKRKNDSYKDNVKKIRRLDSMDKIVSPVVPQPGAWLKRSTQFNRGAGPSGRGPHNRNNQRCKGAPAEERLPQFKEKNKAYQYGNYNRYYGYRNLNHDIDPRLRCFAAYRNIFEGKDILDIGCNIGHITLSVARDFGAKSVVGLDIDKKLIGIARKNIQHYVNCTESPRADQEPKELIDKTDKFFPISMPILYGPVDVPGMQNDEQKGKGFPHNVSFVQGNYVVDDDLLVTTEQPQFDIILCLSVTKWLQLNWGDSGLRQAFRRMYAQLRPGGKLILEPQSYHSYKHKKTLTEKIYKNYHAMEFFPEKFTQYLLSSEVGFAKSEIMGHPHHSSKGFQRPIQIFTKSDLSPSQSQRSYTMTPSHTITSSDSSKQVYTCLTLPPQYENDKSEVIVNSINSVLETNSVNSSAKSQNILNLKPEALVLRDKQNISTEDKCGIVENNIKSLSAQCEIEKSELIDNTINSDLEINSANNTVKTENFVNLKPVVISSHDKVNKISNDTVCDRLKDRVGNIENNIKISTRSTDGAKIKSNCNSKTDVNNTTIKRKWENEIESACDIVKRKCPENNRTCDREGTTEIKINVSEKSLKECDKSELTQIKENSECVLENT